MKVDTACGGSMVASNACFSMTAQKMPNRVESSTHPCFTTLRMLKASAEAPSNYTTPFRSAWNDWITLRNLGGHPIVARIRTINFNTLTTHMVDYLHEVYEGDVQWLPLLSPRANVAGIGRRPCLLLGALT